MHSLLSQIVRESCKEEKIKKLVTDREFAVEKSVAGCGRYRCLPEQVHVNAREWRCCSGVTSLV